MSSVFPIYRRLHEIITQQRNDYDEDTPIANLLELMRKGLKDMLLDCGDFAKKASILDPRFLSLWRSDQIPKEEREHLLHELRKEVNNEIKERERREKTAKAGKEETKDKEEKSGNQDSKGKKEKGAGSSSSSAFALFPEDDEEHVGVPVEDEVTRYFRELNLSKKADPLVYWRDVMSPKFPTLALIARRYFSVVGSSVPSERLFSRAGEAIDLRAALDPALAEQQIYVMQNRHLLRSKI